MLIFYHSLRQQVLEWLINSNHAKIAQNLSIEPRLKQVQNSVFNTADVIIYRHPAINGFL